MEAGGEIARNLRDLYLFVNRHLSAGVAERRSASIRESMDVIGGPSRGVVRGDEPRAWRASRSELGRPSRSAAAPSDRASPATCATSLATGDWEAGRRSCRSASTRSSRSLQSLVERGHSFEPRHANDLARLMHVHAENERLAARAARRRRRRAHERLRTSAGSAATHRSARTIARTRATSTAPPEGPWTATLDVPLEHAALPRREPSATLLLLLQLGALHVEHLLDEPFALFLGELLELDAHLGAGQDRLGEADDATPSEAPAVELDDHFAALVELDRQPRREADSGGGHVPGARRSASRPAIRT